MAQESLAPEQSVEDILESIRQIIVDDEAQTDGATADGANVGYAPQTTETSQPHLRGVEQRNPGNSRDPLASKSRMGSVEDPVDISSGRSASDYLRDGGAIQAGAARRSYANQSAEDRMPPSLGAGEAPRPEQIRDTDRPYGGARSASYLTHPSEDRSDQNHSSPNRRGGGPTWLRDPQPGPHSGAQADPPPQSTPEPGQASPPAGRNSAAIAKDRLLDDVADAAVAQSFAALNEKFSDRRPQTLEDVVCDMLRPQLKTWLDENLPRLVERMVREEIERASRARR